MNLTSFDHKSRIALYGDAIIPPLTKDGQRFLLMSAFLLFVDLIEKVDFLRSVRGTEAIKYVLNIKDKHR